MIDISLNNTIQLNRGDSFYAELFLDEGTEYYGVQHILQEGEYVCFAIEEPNQCFEKAIVRKKFTNENLNVDKNVLITLDPEDTINLLPGTYFYEIKAYTYTQTSRTEVQEDGSYKVVYSTDDVKPMISTAVEKTKFIIL